MKTIVTHLSPDLDAIASVWLIRRYIPGWETSEIAFVPAGETLNGEKVDSNREIMHVDTGLGMFDHHQTSEYTCATLKVFEYLENQNLIGKKDHPALERMANFITHIDHFGEVNFPDPANDVYDFSLHQILYGLKGYIREDVALYEYASTLLEGLLTVFKNKIRAEHDISEGQVFTSKWGKSLAMKTKNEESLKLAMKMGYPLVFRYDPERKFLNIKTLPDKKNNLTEIYTKLKQLDPKATWFFHASTFIIVNGSSRNPNSVPTKLSFNNIIDIIASIK